MLLFNGVPTSGRHVSRSCSDQIASRRPSRIKTLVLTALALAGVSFAAPAFALNMVYLDPSAVSVNEGETFAIQLKMNFTDPTVGGGVEISYDAMVEFVSFDFNQTMFSNPMLNMGPADNDPNQPLEVGFGAFFMAPPFGITGEHVVGTMTFRALGTGHTQFITSAASPLGTVPGPFYGPGATTPLAVSFGTSAVTVVVPEPSTAVLLSLGLVGLALSGSIPRRIG